MADVTGPISTLPGSHHSVPKDAACDTHPDRPATHRVQGETDSFGSEMIDMCDACYAEHVQYQRTRDRSGVCDWCKNHKPRVIETRDYEEGMHGPVYLVCDACIQRRDESLREELARYEREQDDWGD